MSASLHVLRPDEIDPWSASVDAMDLAEVMILSGPRIFAAGQTIFSEPRNELARADARREAWRVLEALDALERML